MLKTALAQIALLLGDWLESLLPPLRGFVPVSEFISPRSSDVRLNVSFVVVQGDAQPLPFSPGFLNLQRSGGDATWHACTRKKHAPCQQPC